MSLINPDNIKDGGATMPAQIIMGNVHFNVPPHEFEQRIFQKYRVFAENHEQWHYTL
jgi:hypothetical protein